jgi:hypothetical protein
MIRIRKTLIIKVIGLVVIVMFSITTTVYGIDLSDVGHLRKPLDFSNVSLDVVKRHNDARNNLHNTAKSKKIVLEEEKLRPVNENERSYILQAIEISIKKTEAARRLKLISQKQESEVIFHLWRLKRRNSFSIYSDSEKMLNFGYFLGPVNSGERFILPQELFNELWFKERGAEYLSDLILFRILPANGLRAKVIGEEKVVKLKQTIKLYIENDKKPLEERNLALLYFEEPAEDVRPMVTEAIQEVIEQLFYQGSEERSKLARSLRGLRILRSMGRKCVSPGSSYSRYHKVIFLSNLIYKDTVAHETGHLISHIFNLKDPFNISGSMVRRLLGSEDENVGKGRDYARFYLEGKVTQEELKQTISEKWLEGRTREIRKSEDFSNDEDYDAGSFLAGLFLELHGNDKKRAMKFALDLTFAEWFNQTSEFLKKHYFLNSLYLYLGITGEALFTVSSGWIIYMLTESAWAAVTSIIIMGVIDVFLLKQQKFYRTQLLNERVKRGDVKDFGAPIIGLDATLRDNVIGYPVVSSAL